MDLFSSAPPTAPLLSVQRHATDTQQICPFFFCSWCKLCRNRFLSRRLRIHSSTRASYAYVRSAIWARSRESSVTAPFKRLAGIVGRKSVRVDISFRACPGRMRGCSPTGNAGGTGAVLWCTEKQQIVEHTIFWHRTFCVLTAHCRSKTNTVSVWNYSLFQSRPIVTIFFGL